MKKILTIIGARPQFIKCAPVTRQLRGIYKEIIVHTGQHYDALMSDVFFSDLGIPKPDYNLDIGSGSHAKQTGSMLISIESVLISEKPDAVIVYGDTNSTLAGALASSKLLIPVMHIEAGLRSWNKKMPEEQNRIIADHLSTALFCPTKQAVTNLSAENITQNVYLTGDVMYDATLMFGAMARTKSVILNKLNIKRKDYILSTIHRAENTNDAGRLKSIFSAFENCGKTVVLPLHPRTSKFIKEYCIDLSSNIILVDPVGYFDMLTLTANAEKVVTDSGGLQKEAFFMNVPCITIRDETEWVELVEIGCNLLVGPEYERIKQAIQSFDYDFDRKPQDLYGDGNSSVKIVEKIKETC